MEASDAVKTGDVASDDEIVVGDPGLGEGLAEEATQEPTGTEDGHGTHTPASAPPASAQSGIPLGEDKDAGVEPDETDVTPPGNPSVAPTPGL